MAMNLLLDTHVLLWYLQDDENLIRSVANSIESMENKAFLSIASLWEIAVKVGLGKLELSGPFDELQSTLNQFNIELLPITFEDTQVYVRLPLHHRDPFDRMLVAQAIARGYNLVSRDAVLDGYDVHRLWG